MTPTPPLTTCVRRGARLPLLLLAAAVACWAAPASAQTAPDRQSDKAVATLIDQVESARDKFEGSLDNSVKQSVFRSATGETSASAFLQDLQDNIKKLKNRFTPGYAASAEVEVVLKQCNTVDAFIHGTPSLTKGRSEWEYMSSTLKSLAGAYGATFPLPTGAPVRRMSDTETADAATVLATAANQFKKQIGSDKTIAKADQTAGKKIADELANASKVLKSRLGDGKPATSEARVVLDLVSQLGSFATAHPSPVAAASLSGVKDAFAKIQQSFGLPLTR